MIIHYIGYSIPWYVTIYIQHTYTFSVCFITIVLLMCAWWVLDVVLTNCIALIHRYIEIFRSSLFEIHGAVGGPNRRLSSAPAMSYSSRPAPYDRGDRFGGANRYQPNNNRGSRNYKGTRHNFNYIACIHEYPLGSGRDRSFRLTSNRNNFIIVYWLICPSLVQCWDMLNF